MPDAWEIRAVAAVSNVRANRDELFQYYLARCSGPTRSALEALHQARTLENNLVNDVPEIMVMREMARRRPTFVLKRGAYTSPGERVEPGPPEKIMPFADDLPRNRLGLAQWVVDQQIRLPRGWQSTACGAPILVVGSSRQPKTSAAKDSFPLTRSFWTGCLRNS